MNKEYFRPKGRFNIIEMGFIGDQRVHPKEALSDKAKEYLKLKGIKAIWDIKQQKVNSLPSHLCIPKNNSTIIECLRKDDNLVVTSGRSTMAHILAGEPTGVFLDRVRVGDTIIGGVTTKATDPPDLGDTTIIHELTNPTTGLPGGTFAINTVTFPAIDIKVNPGTFTGDLIVGGVTTFVDGTATFVTSGVDDRDVLVVDIAGTEFHFGIISVDGETQLTVDNPSSLAIAAASYRVQTPGSQVVFSRVLSGDDFPEAEWGPATVIHEAGLLFTNGSLFNRVVFVPSDPAVGLVLQPTDADGRRIDARITVTVTF